MTDGQRSPEARTTTNTPAGAIIIIHHPAIQQSSNHQQDACAIVHALYGPCRPGTTLKAGERSDPVTVNVTGDQLYHYGRTGGVCRYYSATQLLYYRNVPRYRTVHRIRERRGEERRGWLLCFCFCSLVPTTRIGTGRTAATHCKNKRGEEREKRGKEKRREHQEQQSAEGRGLRA